MELRNEIFAYVYDWLRAHDKVRDQSDLAAKTGINKNTITNILKGITTVSDRTLLKLNEGFDYIFNMQYLRGFDSTHMLVDDLLNDPAHIAPYINAKHREMVEQQKEAIQNEVPDVSINKLLKGIDNLLQISANQIKENEALRRGFMESLEELNNAISQLKDLHPSNPYRETHPGTFGVSDYNEEFKK